MDFVLEYSLNLFVTPEQPYQWILTKIRKWKQLKEEKPSPEKTWRARHHGLQMAPGDQVLCLVGERGIGKTWILRHLAEDDPLTAPMALYLDLEQRTKFTRPEDYVNSVQKDIQKRRGKSGLILLLDAVPPHLDDHLRILEDVVLKPHLAHYGSLVIMALIYPSRVCWRDPILRGSERYLIPAFDEPRTREQLRRLEKAGLANANLKASDVQRSSGGLPLLNCFMATQADEIDSFQLLLEYWLSRVSPDQQKRVSEYVEAVCALDTLEHSKIQQSLDLYSRYRADGAQRRVPASEVRNLLHQHWLAWSTPEMPGRIELVESVRRAARAVLAAREPELFARLQEIA
jgi:hypothetical protein